MPTRKEQLEVGIVATDKASSVIKDVAKEVDKLDGETASIDITAEDKASAEVQQLMARISSLTDDEKKVILTAEAAKLEAEVKRATVLLGTVDGETFTAVLDAKNNAAAKLDTVNGELATFDAKTVSATLDTVDHATSDIRDVTDRADTFDKKSVDVSLGVDDKASKAISTINTKLGNAPGGLGAVAGALTTKAGAITLIGAGLLAAGDNAADLATEAGTLASLFNSTPETVSGLASVLRTTADVEATDLADIIGQMAGALESTPSAAEALGITLDEVRADPVAAFIKAVDKIAEDGKFSFEELRAASVAFGEEGVRQVAAVVAAVGPEGLSGAIDALPDSLIISADDIEKAKTFKREIGELKNTLGGIAVDIGGPVLESLSPLINLVGEAAGLIPTLFDPLTDLISGEQLNIGEVTDEMSNFITLLRSGKTDVEAMQAAYGSTEGLDEFRASVQRARDMIAQGSTAVDAMSEVFGINEENALLVASAYGVLDVATDEVTAAHHAALPSIEDVDAEIDAQVGVLNDQVAALEESADKTNEMADAQASLGDAALDVREAQRSLADATENYTKVMDDNESTANDQANALDDVVHAAARSADAQTDAASATAKANGRTMTQSQLLDHNNTALLNQAKSLEGPMRDAILQYIQDVNGIPEETVAQIRAALERGDITEANRLLQETSRTRTAYVNAEADQGAINQAQAKLDYLARTRYARVVAQTNFGSFGMTAYASGTTNARPGVALVGEQGPELVEFQGGEKVHTSTNTKALTNGAAVGGTVNNYYYAPAGYSSRGVTNANRRYARIQGPS